MKALMMVLALGVVPAFGGSRPAPIRLYVDFQQQPPDAVLDALQEELANIMVPAGMAFEWRSLSETKGNEVSVELAVIHFKGTCDVRNMEPVEAHPGPLGWTHLSDGEILPFSDVSCDGVRKFTQKELLAMAESLREPAYGRALARVLAHELYHIFANTRKHAAWGIGKPAYTVHELLSNRFQFEKKECDLLRAHEERVAAVTEGASGQ